MYYKSTRDSGVNKSSAEAIVQGISSDGGLFVPSEIPEISMDEIVRLGDMSYSERAAYIFAKYLTDFTETEIRYCTDNAYNDKKFATENISEISHLFDGTYILELWHGPTCAFKDMALQILPYLLTTSAKKINIDKKIVILVATSGDTGKAALEGFADVPGTQIMVFYPEDGVSPMQKRQMTTQDGGNVAVCGINGNFDDCQNGVKSIFTNNNIKSKLEANKMMFSSANSINWGRLAPQIIYYISAYATLVKDEELKAGDKINIVVPTGNFGNILAAYYAKLMGIPIDKLICASNENKVLFDFFRTGVYDKNRDFVLTTSPSMDILISSNLERLIYLIAGEDSDRTRALMEELRSGGRYEISADMKAGLADFLGGYASEEETAEEIGRIYEKTGYVMDTHTAVASHVCRKLCDGGKKCVIASTASPYKFVKSVMTAIDRSYEGKDEFALLETLRDVSKTPMPQAIKDILEADIIHRAECDADKMEETVKGILGI